MSITKSGRKSPSYYREILGQQFGEWTVLERRNNRQNKAYYLCRCSCGFEREVSKTSLERGVSRDCGHVKKPKLEKHQEDAFKLWSKEECELIRLWYPVNGSKYLAKVLKRSKVAIRYKAHKMNIKSERPYAYFYNPLKWKASEIEALKKYYPVGGVTACLPHIESRSKDAMRIQARKLGLRYNRGKKNEQRKACA